MVQIKFLIAFVLAAAAIAPIVALPIFPPGGSQSKPAPASNSGTR